MASASRCATHESRPGRFCVEDECPTQDAMGPSEAMRSVLAAVEQVAPTDFTVLLTGETGSGKEVVARAIHRMSPRACGPFVPVDCGSIPPSLMEGELFGHEKGSFTGADRTQPGKFEIASGGTLFLDEISSLPVSMQPKLLRALQERQVWRVGGTESIEVDIRVIAASNQGLASMIEGHGFRRDLFHRLNEFSIVVPPLRERRGDVVFLAERFLALTNRELRKDVQGFTGAAIEVLLNYPWPGNVRELRNVVRRAVLVADGYIEPDHLGIGGASAGADPAWAAPGETFDGSVSFKEAVRRAVSRVERQMLAQALRQTEGNKAKAARLLQIDYKTIHKKARDYGICQA